MMYKTVQMKTSPMKISLSVITSAAVILICSVAAFAQQGMGIGNNNPLEMLDVTGAIKIGTDINNAAGAPAGGAGTVRFRAGIFEGWDGSAWIPLGGGGGTSGAFETTANVTSNNPGTVATDDFVFGSIQLGNAAGTDDDSRLFFDKSKSAFRAGYVSGTQWDDANIGNYSTAMGSSTTASGYFSTAMGDFTTASGPVSTAMGANTYASGNTSTAMGYETEASGDYSIAMGSFSSAAGNF